MQSPRTSVGARGCDDLSCGLVEGVTAARGRVDVNCANSIQGRDEDVEIEEKS